MLKLSRGQESGSISEASETRGMWGAPSQTFHRGKLLDAKIQTLGSLLSWDSGSRRGDNIWRHTAVLQSMLQERERASELEWG